MKRTFVLLSAVFALGLTARVQADDKDPHKDPHADQMLPKEAVVVMFPTEGSKVSGLVQFKEMDGYVHLQGKIRNLTPGKHGFHIHEFGDLRSKDGASAGGHYNPGGHKHGGLEDKERHAGDLGNVEAGEDGIANIDIKAEGLKVHFVIGRALVVHAKEDDLKSQPSGDAGGLAALGVIGIAQVKADK